jgi:bifunctional non-homologous end joining protein LigD
MAKRIDRRYAPGRRSDAWRKIKVRHEQEFAVCGWTPGRGQRAGGVGALVLGCRDAEGWRWVGNAGSGLSDADLDWWTSELARHRIAAAPFGPEMAAHEALRGASWVTPAHVVQIAFSQWTTDRRLRHPTVLGRRHDVAVGDVRCDEATSPDP